MIEVTENRKFAVTLCNLSCTGSDEVYSTIGPCKSLSVGIYIGQREKTLVILNVELSH